MSIHRGQKNAGGVAPVLFSQPAAWAFAGMSRTAWFAAKSAGLLPAPVYIGTSPRPMWRRADLESWAANLPTSRREAVTGGVASVA